MTFVLKSELDAAQALVDLQGDIRQCSCDDISNQSIGNVEQQDSISIFGTFISRTQLTPPGTPKKDIKNKINTKSISLLSDAETQTTSYELEIRDQVIQNISAENDVLKAKIKTIKDEQAESFQLSSDESSKEFIKTQRSYRTRRRHTTANTDSSSTGDYDFTIAVDRSELNDDSFSPKNEQKALKPGNRRTPNSEMVPIGEGNAEVSARVLKNIDWKSYTNATRKLLTAVFSRKVLATHSLTGKPSPAFPDKPAKKKLDAALVNDIVQTVVEKCRVPENVVRTSITTKCADESKMFRTRQFKNKRKSSRKEHRSLSSD